MNKTQQKKFNTAKNLIAAGICGENMRKWDNIFESGHNNSNAVLAGLCRELITDKELRKNIIKNKDYMPSMVLANALFNECVLNGQTIEKDKEISLVKRGSKYFVIIEFSAEIESHNEKNAQFAYNFLSPMMKK